MEESNQVNPVASETIFETARNIRLKKQKQREIRTQDKLAKFMHTNIEDRELGIISGEYSLLTYILAFLFLPWIIGITFVFLYVSKADINIFHTVDTNIFLTWVMGYEVLALFILFLIFRKALYYIFS